MVKLTSPKTSRPKATAKTKRAKARSTQKRSEQTLSSERPRVKPARENPSLPDKEITVNRNGVHSLAHRLTAGAANVDPQERLRELVKLAKEQGYLTYDDINEALPEGMADPDEMEQILGQLRTMEVDIIDASEVDRYKDGKKEIDDEEEEKEQKLDILDDPVRMYLKQMGQVPLLTREQEVEISKRIEDAELMVQKLINRFGFTSRAHLDLAQKLIEGRERFDRVILDKKIESRERYMKALPKLCDQVERATQDVVALYRIA